MSPLPSDENLVFSTVTLTADYADTTSGSLEMRSDDKFTIFATYAKGSGETGNTCQLEISFSGDGTNFVQYGTWTNAATSAFTAITFSFAQDTSVPISLESLGRWLRIRAKETGVASNFGTLKLYLYRNKN